MTTELKEEFRMVKKLIELLRKNKIRTYQDQRLQITFDPVAFLPTNTKQTPQPTVIRREGQYDELL